MRYFVLSNDDLSDDMRAALTRGLGISPSDTQACVRHCLRYGVADVAAFIEELDEARTTLATAQALGATIQVDWRGRLCFDLPRAQGKDSECEQEEPWQSDAWLAELVGETDPRMRSQP